MSQLEQVFAARAGRDELALIAYLTAGYPSLDATIPLIDTVLDAGADIIELGVPFSDPLGDGPVIQASSSAAIDAGATLAATLELVAAARQRGLGAPIALMGYCNPFLRYGLERLFADAAEAGVDALIVPDLPPHEADDWLRGAAAEGIDTVFFVSPGSRPERIALAAARASGFLYCIATTGTTGARGSLAPRLIPYLDQLRDLVALPRAVGFGISHPGHVAALRGHAEGVIVGSALIKEIAAADSISQAIAAARRLTSALKTAC